MTLTVICAVRGLLAEKVLAGIWPAILALEGGLRHPSCSRSHFYNLINPGVACHANGYGQGVRVYEDNCIDYLKPALNEKVTV